MRGRYFVAIIAIISLAVCSCADSNDDNITGRWQYKSALTTTGDILETDSVFYSFDMGVFQLQMLSTTPHEYAEQLFGTYYISTDSIIMEIPEDYFYTASNNKYYDWFTQQRRFAIKVLTKKELEITDNGTYYKFNKCY